MLAAMDFTAIGDFADVKSVLEHVGEGAGPKAAAAADSAIGADQASGSKPITVKLADQHADRFELQITSEDLPNGFCLLGHDHELLVDAGIAEGNGASYPNTLALGGGNL